MTKTIIVGSQNQVKYDCVLQALTLLRYHSFEIIAVDAPSGVADQPLDEPTVIEGVRNRIAFCKTKYPKADLYIAIESGIRFDSLLERYFDFSYTCLVNAKDKEYFSRSVEFEINAKVMSYIHKGINLSDAADTVFSLQNLGKGIGMSGIASNGVIPRIELHLQPTIFAIAQSMI